MIQKVMCKNRAAAAYTCQLGRPWKTEIDKALYHILSRGSGLAIKISVKFCLGKRQSHV